MTSDLSDVLKEVRGERKSKSRAGQRLRVKEAFDLNQNNRAI